LLHHRNLTVPGQGNSVTLYRDARTIRATLLQDQGIV